MLIAHSSDMHRLGTIYKRGLVFPFVVRTPSRLIPRPTFASVNPPPARCLDESDLPASLRACRRLTVCFPPRWLGLTSEDPVPDSVRSPLDLLCHRMEHTMAYQPGEQVRLHLRDQHFALAQRRLWQSTCSTALAQMDMKQVIRHVHCGSSAERLECVGPQARLRLATVAMRPSCCIFGYLCSKTPGVDVAPFDDFICKSDHLTGAGREPVEETSPEQERLGKCFLLKVV